MLKDLCGSGGKTPLEEDPNVILPLFVELSDHYC